MISGRFRYSLRTVTILLSFVTYLGLLCVVTAYSNPWLIIEKEVMIASAVEFPAECIDSYGVERGHLENWTSEAGSCDRRVCYSGSLETTRWQINYDCPEELPDLLDNGNCYYESDTTLHFPQCCPYLVCNNATIETTTLGCIDESPTASCEFWKNLTSCEYDPTIINPDLYNYTVEFCRLTCGHCNAATSP